MSGFYKSGHICQNCLRDNLCGISHGKRSIHWLNYAVVLLVPVEKNTSTLCAGKLLKMADKPQGFPQIFCYIHNATV